MATYAIGVLFVVFAVYSIGYAHGRYRYWTRNARRTWLRAFNRAARQMVGRPTTVLASEQTIRRDRDALTRRVNLRPKDIWH
jgi:hypothetical protein